MTLILSVGGGGWGGQRGILYFCSVPTAPFIFPDYVAGRNV